MGRLDGKVALVTGASGGIGMATLRRLAEEGAAVVGVDLVDEAGEKLVAELTEGGARAVYQHCDVGLLEDVTAAVERAVSEFGRIDVLFNNAATSTGGYIPELDPEGWDASLRVMLTAAMYGMKAAIPHMAAQGGGSIISTSSIYGVVASPGNAPYLHGQGRAHQPDPHRGGGMGPQEHPGQRHLPRGGGDAHVRRRTQHRPQNPRRNLRHARPGPDHQARGNRQPCAVPSLR